MAAWHERDVQGFPKRNTYTLSRTTNRVETWFDKRRWRWKILSFWMTFRFDFSFPLRCERHRTHKETYAPMFIFLSKQHGGSQEGFDMNVIPAWRKGYSGKGIVVSILDDGIQTNHPDLAQNYVISPLSLSMRSLKLTTAPFYFS